MSEQPGHDPDGLDLDPVPGADVSVAGRSPRHDEPTTLAERAPGGPDEAGSRPEVGPSTTSRAAEEPTLAPGDGTGGHITGEATAEIRRDAAPPSRAVATLADGPAGSTWTGGAGPAVIRDFGDYQIVRELARGGMGVVFLARQRSLNRPVAIKMILAGQLANETEIRRFYAEAEAAANLDHPGIVPIYEVGNHEGQHYFSMGFVEGQSLAQRMAGGPLPPLEAAELILRVADAIAYAHRNGVIHRDLKPANILLDKDGNPRVTDFGLAKKVQGDSGLTGSGQVLGTPSYMPPEQAWGKQGEVGPAADVYAIGATLYALVTHRPPFQAATAMDILVQVIGEEPVPPRRLNPAVPMDLDTIILKCLEKEPSRRYLSATALADDLRRYLAGEPILARPVSAAERLWKWVRRRPAIASLAAMAILATAVGIGGILWQWGRAEKNFAEAEVQRRIAQEKTREATEKAELLERQNYINLVALAQRENLANNVGYAERLLDRCPPRLRGWEWGYVNRSDHRELFSVGALPRPNFLRAALDPDATRVVCCGGNDVWIYDLASGRPLHHLKGHEKEVRALAWSPDGATVASGGRDRTIRLWDPKTGAELAVLRGHGSWVLDLAFSPDGQRLLAGAGAWPNEPSNGAELKLWDYRRREARSYPKTQGNSITSVAFSPDGRTIAAGDSLSVARTWDVESGRKVRDFTGAHQMYVMNLAFRRDGRMLATVSEDGTAALWDVATGTPIRILRGHTGFVTGLAFSPDGSRLATGSSDTTIRLWDPDNGREAGLFRGHHGAVNTLQFDRAGTRLLSSGEDGVAKVWDPSRAADPPVLDDHRGWAFSAAFRPGAPVAVTGGWGVIHFWDAASGRLLRSINGPHPREVMALAYSPDGTRLASAGKEGTIKLWDAEADSPRLVIKAHNAPLYALASSPDGASLASGDRDGQVRIWDAATGALKREFRPHAKDVVALAFSPDGRRLATVGLADNVKVWDVTSDAAPLVLDVVTSGLYPIGNAVAFSADGRIAVPRADHRVAIFDARDGRLIRDLAGHTADVNVVAFAPDGRRLATAGDDRTIRLWDPDTGEEMFHLRGHTGGITWITWSADGRRILTTSKDRTGRLWDAGPPTRDVIRDR